MFDHGVCRGWSRPRKHRTVSGAKLRAIIESSAVLSLLAIGLPFLAAPVPARAEEATPTIADTDRAADEATAKAVAAEYGHAVAIDSMTTPTSQTSAEADGSMELMSSSVPVRVEKDHGWVPVDVSLAPTVDGMVAPKTAAVPVEFSAGGSSTLARVQTASGQWVTETWPSALPAPSLDRATATYSEVFSGVDLKLIATPAGMSEVLVVKSETAAANPALESLNLGVTGATLSRAASQSITATTPSGSVASSAAPSWWDSSSLTPDRKVRAAMAVCARSITPPLHLPSSSTSRARPTLRMSPTPCTSTSWSTSSRRRR